MNIMVNVTVPINTKEDYVKSGESSYLNLVKKLDIFFKFQ